MPYYPGRSRSMAFLYEVLKELERKGLVTSYKDGRTSVYFVTEAGLVKGEWDHPIRRSVLTYRITSLGEELFSRELQGTVEKLRDINSFMKTLDSFFKTGKASK